LKAFIVLIFLSAYLSLSAQDEYELGSGYQIGDLPIYIGGYFSVDYRKKDETDRYRIDDIAFISYGGNDTLSYLVELEFKELYVKTYDGHSKTTDRDNTLYIERLYIDYTINDNYKVRVGKYNSPVGFWNVMPINVLRATTSSPVSTKMIFPNYTTGLDFSYSSFSEGEVKLDIMLQDNQPIDDEYNNYDIDKHYALGLSYGEGDYTFKLNGGYFSNKEDKHDVNDFIYALLSARYEDEKHQVLVELGSQESEDSDSSYAGYIQGLYRTTSKHIAVVRL